MNPHHPPDPRPAGQKAIAFVCTMIAVLVTFFGLPVFFDVTRDAILSFANDHYALLPDWFVGMAWFCLSGLILFSAARMIGMAVIPPIAARLALRFFDI